MVREGKTVAILSLGTRLEEAEKAADQLEAMGLSATVADLRFAKPLDAELIRRLLTTHEVAVTIEEAAIGGLGAHVLTLASDEGLIDAGLKLRTMRLPDRFQEHDKPDKQYAEAGPRRRRHRRHGAEGAAPQQRRHRGSPRLISSLLIANRGEIACRVMRTAQRLGRADGRGLFGRRQGRDACPDGRRGGAYRREPGARELSRRRADHRRGEGERGGGDPPGLRLPSARMRISPRR